MPEITDRAEELLTPEERRIVARIRAAMLPEGMSVARWLQARCERLELQIREVFDALCELIAEDTPEGEMPSPTGLTEVLAKAIPDVDYDPLPECWQRVLLDYRTRQDTAIEVARVTEQRDRALRVVAAAQDLIAAYDDGTRDGVAHTLHNLRVALARATPGALPGGGPKCLSTSCR